MKNQIVVRNQKAALKLGNNAIAAAVILLGKHDAETVCKIIWNKYGFLSDVIGATLKIHGIGEIELSD